MGRSGEEVGRWGGGRKVGRWEGGKEVGRWEGGTCRKVGRR